ncbi:MAG: SusF/SusE family outer membrane protein [Mangrovibacterium sp.]
MKNISYFLILILAVFAFSCEEDFMTPPVKTPVEGTAPVWVNQPSSDIDTVLFKRNENGTLLSLSWTAPVYADNIGVRYFLQLDTKGTNFANPIEFDRIAATEMTVTIGQLNAALMKRYNPAEKVEIEIRIRAASNEHLADLYTEPFSMKVTPYLDVPVPSAFYMMGTATEVGFTSSDALAALKDGDVFYKYLKLTADGAFRFSDAQSDGGFAYNYGKFATVSSNIAEAGDEDGNFKFTGETGWYEVKADFTNSELTIAPFQVGTTTYTFDPAEVYLVGDYTDTVASWSPENSPAMIKKSEGIYTIETAIKDGAMLKFVGQPSWGDLDWGNLGGDGSEGIVGPKGKNGNITFDGAGKGYIVTLDMNKGTYTIAEAKSNLYIVGEATSAGWTIENALIMNIIAPGVWTGTFELKAGKDFKFFPVQGSWDNGIGADRFDNFIGCSANGGDITNNGPVDGTYLVVVDLNTKTLTVTDAPKILGGSVAADWNPANAVAMQMVESGVFDTYQYITVDGGGFKFVPTNAGWDGDWGASKTTAGMLAQTDEDNLSVAADGFYRVRTNFNDMSYSVVETAWGIIGDATPGGWGDDTNMTLNTTAKGEYTWSADITLTDGKIKFRANDGWDINLGDNDADGSLEPGGSDIAVTAGNYHIELILNSATGFTYTITAN